MRRRPVLDDRWDYKWGVVAKGLIELWPVSGDRRYFDHARRSVDAFVHPDGSIATYDRGEFTLDHVNPGKVLFPLWRETHDGRYRAAIEILRDQLREHPRTPSGSFWHKGIYPDQMWLDGVYMASPFLAEYGATFGEPEVFADVVAQFTLAYEHARDDHTGLLLHAVDERRSQTWADARGRSPCAWGRALGWYEMALVDALDILTDVAQRETLIGILRETIGAVLRVRDESALWWQVLDQGGRDGNYLEESASAMFAYAIAKGARQGHLPSTYRDIARRSHEAIVERFVRAGPGGVVDVCGCCVGTGVCTGPGDSPYRDGSFAFYAARPVATNDHHGVGAFLLASVELERTV